MELAEGAMLPRGDQPRLRHARVSSFTNRRRTAPWMWKHCNTAGCMARLATAGACA